MGRTTSLIATIVVGAAVVASAGERPAERVRPYTAPTHQRQQPIELDATPPGATICPQALGVYAVTLTNNTGATTSFDILYSGFDWNVSGESTVGPVGNGQTAEFWVRHRPPDSAMIGQADTILVTAQDQSSPHSASLDLTTSITPYWVTAGPHAPDVRMDHAVIAGWGPHPPSLWAIGGYDGSYPTEDSQKPSSAVAGLPNVSAVSPEATVNMYRHRYLDWDEGPPDEFPIPFPGDHAYGWDVSGEAVVVAFPDATKLSDALLHVLELGYPRRWTRQPLPTGFPADGIWAHDISCDPSTNLCFITGGASTPGGGDLSTVFAHDVGANTVVPLPPFSSPRAHHASFLLGGLLCIAGGIDAADTPLSSTQCYDLATDTWRPENADLGPLPGSLWGMGDAVLEIGGELRPVMAGGISENGLPGTHFLWHDGTAWQYDDPFAYGVYRTEADAIGNDLFLVGGSTGDLTPTNLLQHLHWCPSQQPEWADCTGAAEVQLGECINLSNEFVGDSGPPLPSCESYEGGDFWVRVTVPDAFIVTVTYPSASPSTTGPSIAAYAECPHQIELFCNEGTGASVLTPVLDGPGTFWFRIWERGNDSFGEFEVCVEPWIPVELLKFVVE